LTRQSQPDFERAVILLCKIVSSEWDGRFPEIQTIALHELNDALARAPQAQQAKLAALLDAQGMDHRLLESVPVDLRVVLTWDADNTDIDLWVIDPTGDVAIYSQPHTRTGGRVSRDFTGGYGPEVFTIRRPIPGTYTVKANYYGSRQQKVTGDVTVQVEFFTQFDSGQNQREAVTRRLEDKQELIEVGKFVVAPQ
jgi:Ca-activated chloride channel family protein